VLNVTPHTSHLTPHTSHLTPHTLLLPYSPFSIAVLLAQKLMDVGYFRLVWGNRWGLHVLCNTLHVTRHTSHVTRHTSHVTHPPSHVTRHTSHVTRHTSHVTRHTSRSKAPLDKADGLLRFHDDERDISMLNCRWVERVTCDV